MRIFEADVPREEGAFVQAVAVSPDGTYVVVAAGAEVIRYKKKENTRKETYEVEATMAPAASYARSDVMALCVVNNRLFTGGDDLPELLPREAAQAPAPRGFARPGDLSAGGGVV